MKRVEVAADGDDDGEGAAAEGDGWGDSAPPPETGETSTTGADELGEGLPTFPVRVDEPHAVRATTTNRPIIQLFIPRPRIVNVGFRLWLRLPK